MNPKLRTPLILIGVITMIVIAIFVLPRGLSLYYQIKGGQRIDYVLRFEEGIQEFVCGSLPPTNEEARKEVENGIADLKRALRLNKNNAQAYYYLGKANCLLGDPGEAKENYLQYTFLRPDNPLGHLELGFAYANECIRKMGDYQKTKMCNLSPLRQSMLDEWRLAGVEPESIINQGNQAYSYHQYKTAAQLYHYASLVVDVQDSEKFRWSIAEILAGNDLSKLPEPYVLAVQDLDDYLEIKGNTFQSMLEFQLGKPIGDPTSEDTSIGYLAFQGSAIIVVNVLQESSYHITINAQNSSPPPIQLQLEIDFNPIASFELTKGDGSWEELSTDFQLDSGLHIIGINYLNDAVINGVDRNAVVEWLRIHK